MIFLFSIFYFRSSPSSNKHHFQHSIFYDFNWQIHTGDFTAEAWSQQTRSYYEQPDLGIFIHVDEIFDNNHRVVSQRGGAKGRFTFTAADAGEHRICFQPTGPPAAAVGAGNILVGGAAQGGIKFGIDLVIGETSHLESADKGKFDNMVQKVKDLNARLKDIKREQAFQRVRAVLSHVLRIPSVYSCSMPPVVWLTLKYRTEKQSFEISQSWQTLVLWNGHYSN